MKNFISLSIVAAIIVACTTTEQANEALNSRFVGKKADDFFVAYGPPSQSYTTADGRTVFIWAENPKNYYVAPSAHTTINSYGNTAYANTTYSGGGTIEVQCQLQLTVSPNGTIQQIRAHRDTIGSWEMSRCHELFKQQA